MKKLSKIMFAVGTIGFVMCMSAGLVLGAFRSYKPLVIPVTPTSRIIVPPTTPQAVTTWTAGTAYVYGNVVRNTNQPPTLYWCIADGTATNIPTTIDGDESDGSALVWRMLRQQRDFLVFVNPDAIDVWLAFGGTNTVAVTNRGVCVQAGGVLALPSGADCPQQGIYAVLQPGYTNHVGVQEN